MTTRTIDRPKTFKLAEPAKRWRNHYRALVSCIDEQGTYLCAGQRCHTEDVWPSREVAEQKAHEFMTRKSNPLCLEYLGAFPVEAP